MAERVKRCIARVWTRDTYRYTGRGKSGFELHYNQNQCSRGAKPGCKFCGQHQAMVDRGRSLVEAAWHEWIDG